MGRLSFVTRILLNYGSDKNCPFCNSPKTNLLARKNLLLQLRKCESCDLMFRWPKETPGFAEKFYQNDYQEVSFTTELPDEATLNSFIANNFAGSPKDFADQISILKTFVPGGGASSTSAPPGIWRLPGSSRPGTKRLDSKSHARAPRWAAAN